MDSSLQTYQHIQKIGKTILKDMSSFLSTGMNAIDIEQHCLTLIAAHHIQEFWYHDIPVMVAIDEQTTLSCSGKDYASTNITLHPNSFLTIDLSLAINQHWGIAAQSYALQQNQIQTSEFTDPEIHQLYCLSDSLHQYFIEIAHPLMSFHELYLKMHAFTEQHGIQHLDFKHNFGHSIEKNLDDRIYIQQNVHEKLGHRLLSFEPHLQLPNGKYGFKSADIYMLNNRTVERVFNENLFY